ncbi:MAG TPA: YlxR family protein [Jiangellaceae bacterium]|nr:YlxR family protein [Jiangellaceae bacterium]
MAYRHPLRHRTRDRGDRRGRRAPTPDLTFGTVSPAARRAASGVDLSAVQRSIRHVPARTCVGCRARAAKTDLLRVVVIDAERSASGAALVADPGGRLPGRGAYLHRDIGCLDLADRRVVFPRALRRTGPLSTASLRRYLEEADLHRDVPRTGGNHR